MELAKLSFTHTKTMQQALKTLMHVTSCMLSGVLLQCVMDNLKLRF